MVLLSNTFTGKLKILAENIFYRIAFFKAALFLRGIYLCLSGVYSDFIKILKYGTTDIFNDVLIETTTHCNRRCSYCPNSVFPRGLKENEKLMPTELFKKIIGDLRGINFKGRISPHLYGEPLLDKRLPDLMEYVRRNLPQAKVVIFTNGDFLNAGILDRLYEAGVRSYYISLHENSKEAVREISDLIKYIRKNKKKIRIDTQIFYEDTPLFTRAGLVKPNNIAENLSCLYPLTINYKGDVLVCCNDYLGESAFGNLEKERLMDIWNKSGFKKIREELNRKIYTLDICKRCRKNM
ncbi:MAG: hypothetical protein COW11_02875 [Candidatus Omnitrophica bacterium CG12_big_fil_rev_8_21_14_0_65_43_15]|uniref:Radical SAM core domain-containing protein n=1 Tax=Candidatus Taenaricola geysiri TaxID=1974752 RepID=A0A2J0LH49_9BACT|nr:MAG: hypothetical protein AUJ89_04230 [Candidatus Omnitrophica bacterium CG1_02_43_210]PIR65956.1 MAG: hypothetical protein COU52_01365 [Candidatus Omnitrophica bacterium CG10_big_fil_rev_8_21_14_0_10_43_8]PIV11814.1 MAG: hypothetical protein COS48_03960 [Candidatus Omnitrophica bacterium CG03_land_8_20_14_0_80_43_22]PIW66519.1 MAG: hypothetical protein COW11_02875 [Candidatus Omnitrophica bacterium CG12_big_fil_rev_8_21_14_0_65_43_15]PIY84753.1 MAG: hypothetical protein COY77_00770 [Candida